MSEPKYKWVPVEPTREMIDAGLALDGGDDDLLQAYDAVYKAMLAAAPSPPQDPRDEVIRVAREALAYYGRHTKHCLLFDAPFDERAGCTCGLEKAVHQIKELMGEK